MVGSCSFLWNSFRVTVLSTAGRAVMNTTFHASSMYSFSTPGNLDLDGYLLLLLLLLFLLVAMVMTMMMWENVAAMMVKMLLQIAQVIP
jgi:hypothetical protein